MPSSPVLAVGTRSRPVATLLWAGVTLRETTKRIGALLALAAACAAWPLASFAQDNTPAPPPASAPGLLVSPTYVLLDGRTRSQALLLSNRGVSPETYRITIVNRLQKSDGQLVETDKPGDGEGFASTIVRYAPREVVLPPDKPQTVRLLLQMPANLPDGEYRSHILFQQIPTAKPTDDVSTTVAPGLSVTIRAVFGVTIPLIVRKGALAAERLALRSQAPPARRRAARHIFPSQPHRHPLAAWRSHRSGRRLARRAAQERQRVSLDTLSRARHPLVDQGRPEGPSHLGAVRRG